ncbi:MAG: lipopolysaccharide core heptose(I) kinase RfaP [Halieaceae bacterium]|jgi:heptose I phosphotransferase|nr:lipopolysaccharide core heptose(I) kinase RfaP [Halieaceae bacterium]
MPDFYLANGFALGELARARSADPLLRWAHELAAAAQPEDVYRNKEGRKTLRFEYRGKPFFLKLHTGVGWVEVIKNLLQLRLPVVSARNEFRAVLALQRAGVYTLTIGAYARKGWNPAAIRSMIVTSGLTGTVSLEDFCADWASAPPAPAVRMGLIRTLADSAQRMHRAGINHRDFYLCHFHLDESSLLEPLPRCYLIDLHRAQIRGRTPRRWQVKDLAALYFSAMDCGLQRRDLLRFMRHYSQGGLRSALGAERRLWRQVERRALELYSRSGASQPSGTVQRGRQHGQC